MIKARIMICSSIIGEPVGDEMAICFLCRHLYHLRRLVHIEIIDEPMENEREKTDRVAKRAKGCLRFAHFSVLIFHSLIFHTLATLRSYIDWFLTVSVCLRLFCFPIAINDRQVDREKENQSMSGA